MTSSSAPSATVLPALPELDPSLAWPRLLTPYCDWVVSRWSTRTREGLDERDFTVMTLGFAGETGEVAEAVLAAGTHPDDAARLALMKELGDVAYYWARIVRAFGLDESHCAQDAERAVVAMPSGEAVVHLCARVGRVAELMKKRVRDDVLEHEVLQAAMGEALGAWLAVCAQHGVSASGTLVLNQRKVNDRHARGVVRGNGDNR